MLQKTDLSFIETVILDSEPALALGLNLIDKLEERSLLQEAVADIKLNFSKDFEKL